MSVAAGSLDSASARASRGTSGPGTSSQMLSARACSASARASRGTSGPGTSSQMLSARASRGTSGDSESARASRGTSGVRLLVLFRLGPHRFAIEAEHVVEICEVPEQGPPGASFLHRGREVPLVDLHERFGVEGGGVPRAVLVTRPPASPDPLALLVGEVDAVIPFAAQTLLRLPDPLHALLGDDLQGLCVLPGGAAAEPGDVAAVLGAGALRIGGSRLEGGGP